MSSPFSIFRRHQRILMVVTTGLAMISFVLLGAISDPRNMPMPLVVIFLASMVGGLFWLAGLSRGKGADWGITGVILGVLIGLGMIYSSREAAAVSINGGDLTQTELRDLFRQRQVANQFVQMAAFSGVPESGDDEKAQQARIEASQRIQQNMFGFMSQNNVTREDVVLGEVLRRKAKEIGMVISDEVVMDFIKDVSGNKLTGSEFAKIRKDMRVSEAELVECLRQEILAKEAAQLLSGQSMITPQNQWEFYKKLNVKQSAELVAIPVSSFVTDKMKPTDEELQNLLNEYNENIPGYTPEMRPEEGRPGFFQLPKHRIAYLEAIFDDVQATVGEVTDEEIQEQYDLQYPRELPPDLDLIDEAGEKTEEETTNAPELPPAPKSDDAPAETEGSESESEAKEPAEEKEETEGTPQSSLNNRLENLQFVAVQDEPAANAAEETKTEAAPAGLAAPKVEAATTEEPAAEGDAKLPPPVVGPERIDGEGLPPAPATGRPELTDELKEELKQDILRSRTTTKITELMQKAENFTKELADRFSLGPQEEEYISLEDATKEIRKFAKDNNLEYIETSFLTLNELADSEDYPIGRAFVLSRGSTVAQLLQQSVPDQFFRVERAIAFDFSGGGMGSQSQFLFWKTAYNQAYAPKTIDQEPAVRRQVLKAWEQQQAEPAAIARAEELVKVLMESDKPMSEAFSEETVTGEEGSLFLTVRETGEFTQYTQGMPNPNNPFQQNPPQLSQVQGAEEAGQRFFTKVFDEMEQGDVGIAPSRDGSVYYVVRIKDRTPSSEDELNSVRGDFLAQGEQMAYLYMRQELMSQFTGNWASELMDQYGVQYAAEPVEDDEEEVEEF